MKKVEVVKSSEVEIKPFILKDFTQGKEMHGSMKKVSKKELKHLADLLGLSYDDAQLVFSKKLLNEYLK
ncbi:MAG: hypothetical protein COA92_03035 [Sulfurovum sp.]|nr:MAG: hypothetical protein COA92_03035 [Sulfurovum sp.]